MSIEFREFSTLENAIIEALRRGEEVDVIARNLDTKPGYIYNTRAKAKKMGIIIEPNLQNNNQQPAQPQRPQNPNPRPDPRTSIPAQPATNVREPDEIIQPHGLQHLWPTPLDSEINWNIAALRDSRIWPLMSLSFIQYPAAKTPHKSDTIEDTMRELANEVRTTLHEYMHLRRQILPFQLTLRALSQS